MEDKIEISKPPSILSIHNHGDEIVRIEQNGQVVVNPKYNDDAAARSFWEAVSKYLPSQRIGAITALDEAQRSKMLFVAGGISRCPDWQATFLDYIKDAPILAMNPRRSDFDVSKTEESLKQIAWEHKYLTRADAVSFWFPEETDCPITLFELGAWSMSRKPIFVGCHPGYRRSFDVDIQLRLVRPEVRVVHSLEELARQVTDWAKQGD